MSEQDIPFSTKPVRQRYEEALEAFIVRVKQDRYIVAAILYGSLAYDEVWEKSDIDIMLLTRDDKAIERFYALVEHDIDIHVTLEPRSKFKAAIERALSGSFVHSITPRSTLLFSTDEAIREYYERLRHVGSRDREMQLMNATSSTFSTLTKAEKWFMVKQDPTYSFLWIMFLLNDLARVEVLWNADVPGREVIQQALAHNPAFFTPLYVDLIHQPKDASTIRHALQMIHTYLDEKVHIVFAPLLTYLAEAGSARTVSEISEYFEKRTQAGWLFSSTCEWLADKGILYKVSSPLHLTEKSRVTVDEAAYYYDGDDADGTN